MTSFQFFVKRAYLSDIRKDSDSIAAELQWNVASRERDNRIAEAKAIFCYLSSGGSDMLETPAGINFIQKIKRDLDREAAEAISSIYK